jgi:hypothetical protein
MKPEYLFFIVGIPVVLALVVLMRVDLILQYFSDRKDKSDSKAIYLDDDEKPESDDDSPPPVDPK